VKERRGPVGRVTGLAETVGGALRRRQRRREPRIVLYDAAGHARVLAADAPGAADVLATAARLVALAAEDPEAPPGRGVG
jgi:hypothetical protein